MSNDNQIVTVGELYDAVAEVQQENPRDGRTKEGRAWHDGAWAVMQKVYALIDKQVAS